jgi:protein-disulfide isomerase
MEKSIKILLPIVLLAAVTAGVVFYFQKKNQELVVKKNDNIVVPEVKSAELEPLRKIDGTDYVWGSESAPVEMIVYSDFECPFCATFTDAMAEIQKNYPNNVKIAFRHYVLATHSNAITAALAVECAGEQGKFWEMHDRLFIDNRLGRLNEEQYYLDASALNLNADKFKDCVKSEKYKEKILSQIAEAESFGITGTPTIFINNQVLPGAYPYEDFVDSTGIQQKGLKSIIEEELARF